MACRLAWVVGFTMGPFPGNERTWKPFNPILGETFELDLPERGVRFVAEQVRADVGRSVHGWQPGGLVWGNHTTPAPAAVLAAFDSSLRIVAQCCCEG